METRSPTEILHQVFPGLNDEDVAELASVAEQRSYPPGTILCQEGRAEKTFYVIISGRAEVTKYFQDDRQRVLYHPGAGEFFGEIALVQEGFRTASVRTLEPTTVLEIDRDAFISVLQRSASMAVHIMLQVTNRLRDADRRAISDLRRKNIELEEAYRALETQQQQRSAFLTTVAHELRTPLTAATGYLQFVNSGAVSTEDVPEFLHKVARNLETVVDLVNSILLLQELEMITPEFELLAAGEVVTGSVQKGVDQAVAAGLTIDLHVDETLPQVMGDAGSLGRAVDVLPDNAVKFSPNGGTIHVRVRAEDQTIRIEISDPGVGFPIDQLDELFTPFTRIESVDGHLFGGVGLGLPIARQIVESHGGHLQAESVRRKGSTFTIVLPIAEEAVA